MAMFSELGYKRVFVALDGSDAQYAVLHRAIIVAENNQAELYIGHVIDSSEIETSGAYTSEVVTQKEQEFTESIKELVEEAKLSPQIPRVETMIRCGRITETLKLQMLDIINPEIVVCGARGLSGLSYMLLGSISTFLMRNCSCDVLVVKDPLTQA